MSYCHLNARERYAIFHLHMYGCSCREIGRRLGRSHTTISRELQRNIIRRGSFVGHYLDDVADSLAALRRSRPRHAKRRHHGPLTRFILWGLRQDWSPEIISKRLVMRFPHKMGMRISAETIYRWVYHDARAGGDLHRHLLRRHRRRRQQRRGLSARGGIPGRLGIEHRPVAADARSEYGHWEGDTVEGKKSSHGVVTLLDRKSRLLITAKLPGKKAIDMSQTIVRQLSQLPANWRRTLTLDNGKEFTTFAQVEKQAELKVYFANPYAPWERGSNEQVNGLLRFYFPKGTDWSTVSTRELANAQNKLNNRPRKCLGYRTPNEVARRSIRGALGM